MVEFLEAIFPSISVVARFVWEITRLSRVKSSLVIQQDKNLAQSGLFRTRRRITKEDLRATKESLNKQKTERPAFSIKSKNTKLASLSLFQDFKGPIIAKQFGSSSSSSAFLQLHSQFRDNFQDSLRRDGQRPKRRSSAPTQRTAACSSQQLIAKLPPAEYTRPFFRPFPTPSPLSSSSSVQTEDRGPLSAGKTRAIEQSPSSAFFCKGRPPAAVSSADW